MAQDGAVPAPSPVRAELVPGFPDAHVVADLRALARSRLPRGLFEFVDRGSESELALRGNREALDRIKLWPRGLVDLTGRTARTSLFGRDVAQPFAIAPTGAAGLLWFDGEIALARAAAAAGVPFTLSTASITSMEDVAEQAGGRLWFQLYMWPDRRMSYQLLERVAAAGYEALLVTIDTAVSPKRDYNQRNGFSVPITINRHNALDVALHPAWMLGTMARYLLRNGIPRHQNYPEELRRSLMERPKHVKGTPKNETLVWDDLRELRKRWKGPLLVKGVMHPDDARHAIACGADGVVVSNHGARNFDLAIPAVDALPAVAEAVGARGTVLVDSGFQQGSDVVKALSLGAKAVLLGRAPLWGVAAGGAPGVARVLRIMADDVERTMAFMGCRTVAELGPQCIARGPEG
ncbi:MAG: alpha-hydroxy-acid oxidizing protein [Oxalobacteraceae bacterium]|nr:MAG: alpha-hydroxy-acid oxidizing protein [Oxalobacteraceae bacterium]